MKGIYEALSWLLNTLAKISKLMVCDVEVFLDFFELNFLTSILKGDFVHNGLWIASLSPNELVKIRIRETDGTLLLLSLSLLQVGLNDLHGKCLLMGM